MEEHQLTKKEKKEIKREERRSEVQKTKQQQGFKRLVTWGLVITLFGAGLFGVISLVPEAPETQEGSNLPVLEAADHFKGLEDASVVLVEYGDFQCPACGTYFPLVRDIAKEFESEVKFVFRHYPLRSIHAQAQLASQAAEAAALQGKFWEMHDKLFEGQSTWAENRNASDIFMEYASQLGLDAEQFAKDLDSSFVKDKVQKDLSGGTVAGVPGTPTFFLQGQRIVNPQNYEAFQSLLEQALATP